MIVQYKMLAPLFLFFLAIAAVHVHAAGTETLIGVVGRDFVMLGADQSVARSIVLTSTEVDKLKVIEDRILVAAAGELADVDDIYTTLKTKVILSELAQAAPPRDVPFVDLSGNNKLKSPAPWTVLSVSAVAKVARHEIAQRVRSRAPYQGLGLLVAGMQQLQPEQHTKILWKSGITTTSSSLLAEEIRRQLRVASSSSTSSEDSPPEESSPDKEEDSNLLQPCLFWLDEYGSCQKLQYGIHGLGASFGLAVLDQGFRENLTRKEAAELIQNCFQQLQTRFIINSPKAPLIKCVDAEGCHIYKE